MITKTIHFVSGFCMDCRMLELYKLANSCNDIEIQMLAKCAGDVTITATEVMWETKLNFLTTEHIAIESIEVIQ